MRASKIQSKILKDIKVVANYFSFIFHIEAKTKSNYKILKFALQICFLPFICFPQKYVQCHVWSCVLSAKWRLKRFMNNSGTFPFQYLKTIFSLHYYTLSLAGSRFTFLKRNGSILHFGGKFRQKRIHLFWAFWSLSFKFFFKIWLSIIKISLN